MDQLKLAMTSSTFRAGRTFMPQMHTLVRNLPSLAGTMQRATSIPLAGESDTMVKNVSLASSMPKLRDSLSVAADPSIFLQSVFDSAPVGLCFIDCEFRYVTVNECFARMYQLPISAFLGRTIREALPKVAEPVMAQLQASLEAGTLIEIELTVERADPNGGTPQTLLYHRSAQPMGDASGTIIGFSVALMDITEQKAAEAALRESEENLRCTVDLNPHIPFTADAQGNILDLSPRFLSITGMTSEEATLEGWVNAIHPDHRVLVATEWQHSVSTGTPFNQTYRLRCASDIWRWVRGRAFPRYDTGGAILRWYGTLEDIHERKLLDEALKLKTDRLEEVSAQLARLVRQDHLTGLANRRHFDDALEQETARARRSHQPLALIMIDVDHFKLYNDTYGHPAGDECLRSIAQALAGVLRRQSDLAARYGGEEFVILLPDTPEEGALEVAHHANASVRELCLKHSGSPTGVLTISAGVAMAQFACQVNELNHASELVQSADLALYAAKSAGRDQVVTMKLPSCGSHGEV